MSAICILIFVIMTIVSYLIYKTIKNPVVLFNLFWSFLIFISILGYNGIRQPSSEIYAIFLIGGMAFNVATIFYNIISTNINFKSAKNIKLYKEFKNSIKSSKYILYIQLVLLLYYIIKTYGLINSLSNGLSYGDIRSYYFSNLYLSSQFEYLLVTYVFDPLLLLTQILFGINIFKKIYSKKISLLMLINIVLRSIISGGRMVLLELAIIIIFCYLTIGTRGKIKINIILRIATLIIILTCIAVIITTGRGKEGSFIEIVREMLVVNFTGSFTYLDNLISNEKFIGLTYGGTAMAGIVDPFISIFRFLNITNLVTRQVQIGNITSIFVPIGTYSYNAMPTMYYYFITDFGYFGIVFWPFILGVISMYIYQKINMNRNIKHFIFYILLILTIVESPMTWLPLRTSFVMVYIYSIILFVSRENRIDEK